MKLMIGVPCFGAQMHTFTVESLLNTARFFDAEVRFVHGDPCLDRARNSLLYEFYKDDVCTHFLSIDADMVFAPENAERLADFGRADHAIVAAPYRRKTPDVQHNVVAFPEENTKREGEFFTVARIGLGFCLIPKEALRAYIGSHRAEYYHGMDKSNEAVLIPRFCSLGGSLNYQCDSYSFCDNMRASGIDIWLDSRNHIGHVGQTVLE